MKPKLSLLLLVMVFLAGCQWLNQKEEISYPQSTEINSESQIVSFPVDSAINQAVDLFQLKMNESQLAAIIHEPSTEQLNVLNKLDVAQYYQIPSDERLLIIPKNIGSKISIYEITFKDNELIETKLLLESQLIEDKQIFDLKCIVPEGIPQIKIVIEYKGNQAEYLVTYDGMGLRSQIEFLEYKD